MEESLQQLIMQAIQELLAHQVDIFLFAYHFNSERDIRIQSNLEKNL